MIIRLGPASMESQLDLRSVRIPGVGTPLAIHDLGRVLLTGQVNTPQRLFTHFIQGIYPLTRDPQGYVYLPCVEVQKDGSISASGRRLSAGTRLAM